MPHLPFYYARFLAHSVATSLVPLASIVSALDPLIDARLVKADVAVGGQAGAAFLLVEILRALAQLEAVGEAGRHVCRASRASPPPVGPASSGAGSFFF